MIGGHSYYGMAAYSFPTQIETSLKMGKIVFIRLI